jgi:hypothetical protein
VSKTTVQPVEEITWEGLRRRATVLGVPAWRLAEQFASHEIETVRLVFKIPASSTKT